MGEKSIKAFSECHSFIAVCVFLSFSGWDQSAEAKKSEAQRFRRLHMPGVRPQRVQHRGQVGNLQAHKRNKYAGVYFLLDSVMKSCFLNPTFVLPQKFHTLIFLLLNINFHVSALKWCISPNVCYWSVLRVRHTVSGSFGLASDASISGTRQARTPTSPNLLPCKLWPVSS